MKIFSRIYIFFCNFVTEKLWKKKGIINYILLPFSYIYFFIYKIRNILAHKYKSKLRIICVGNILVGGTGKTPIVLSLYKLLKENGYNPVILSKGYKGKIQYPLLVNSNYCATEVGDEALMCARHADIVISKNRIKGIKFIENNYKYNLIITDDGLQNPYFHKDLVFLIEDNKLNHNNMLFPAGCMREKNANFNFKIIYNNIDIGLQNETYINPIINTNISELDNKLNYIIFCGIGNPLKFFNLFEGLNFKITEKLIFPDHYNYCEYDALKLMNLAKKLNAVLITTEKDWVKLNNFIKDLLYIKLTVDFQPQDSTKILNKMKEIL